MEGELIKVQSDKWNNITIVFVEITSSYCVWQ